MKSLFWHGAAIAYAHLYFLLHKNFKMNPPGLGWLMRRIGTDLVLDSHGSKFYMYHPIAGSNAMHIIGRWNEPETHTFVREVLKDYSGGITFIDVGANIGEMAVDFATHPAVRAVYAFEPVPSCLHALTISAAINRLENLRVRQRAVGLRVGTVRFVTSTTNPSSGGMAGFGNTSIEVLTTTLDTEFPDALGDTILLLDIEGAEYEALQGGSLLIARELPLIIFEYNEVSRKSFTLVQMQQLLGDDYEFFRLRTADGLLDKEFDDTWNIVAAHRQSAWHARCRRMIYPTRG